MAKKKYPIATRIIYDIEDIWYVYVMELRRIFHDAGVMVIFFLASLLYPLLYPTLYYNEAIVDLPIAVVDESCSATSRDYIRKLDATRAVSVAYKCTDLTEARQLYEQRKIHGAVYFPKDFENQILTVNGQATVSVYCDMSSFLYYKNMMEASNFVMLNEHNGIQVHRYELLGNDRAMAEMLAQPLKNETIMLYNPGGGYPSFLLPAILVLIIFQTLFLGICMLAGVAREQNGELYFIEGRKYDRSTFRLIFGKGLAYFTLYIGISVFALGVVPRIFHLPQIGLFSDVIKFIIPFLLSTIFFAMTISVYIRERETVMVIFLFTSVIYLFLSGVSWPMQNMPRFWQIFAMIFPSTWGINGYIHISSLGCTLQQTSREYIVLWIQSGVYFFTASLSYYLSGWYYEYTLKRKEKNKEVATKEIVTL